MFAKTLMKAEQIMQDTVISIAAINAKIKGTNIPFSSDMKDMMEFIIPKIQPIIVIKDAYPYNTDSLPLSISFFIFLMIKEGANCSMQICASGKPPS